jgi:cell division septum initiation protein DivIVA
MKSLIPTFQILEQHVGVLGKTRTGKSSVMRQAFVEPLLKAGKPVTIIDPKGDWWGIKSTADGKHAGFPVVIFGGKHADIPINEHSGKHVAELVAAGNRPCLIDLGGWRVGERTRFYVDFASTLYLQTQGHRWLVIDEVHNFAPQVGNKITPLTAEMVHWSNRIASEGLGKGLALIVASQRPQKVHKDLLTSIETMIAMKVLHVLDRNAVKDWVDGCGEPVKAREVVDSLGRLQRGEGWVWSPEIGFGPIRLQFPLFETYDSFKPQRVDQRKLKGWASVDLDDVRSKLEAVVKEAEANDPTFLKKRVRELEKQLAKGAPRVAAAPAIAEHASKGELRKATATVKRLRGAIGVLMDFIIKINVRDLTANGDVDQAELQKAVEAAVNRASKLIESNLAQRNKALEQLQQNAERIVERVRKLVAADDVTISVDVKQNEPFTVAAAPRPVPPRPAGTRHDGVIGAGEQKILIAIAQNDAGVYREQLTILTGYKRSTRDAYIQRLATKGLIDVGPPVRATEAGIEALPADFEPLPTGDALREHWIRTLPVGERAVLEVLAAAHPDAVSRDEITDRTSYKRSTRDAYIQRLTLRKLVVSESGAVRASPMLFD